MLWGECRGSAATPYRTVVDLAGPAYQCSCPSRKFPCKHVLALLLLWAEGSVKDDAGDPPDWAAGWFTGRSARSATFRPGNRPNPRIRRRRLNARSSGRPGSPPAWPNSTGGSATRSRHGLAASPQAGYGHWDDIAARMVDAQAPGLAERLRALASVSHSGAGWDGRLLEEYALLHLLAVAYRRQAELPPPLRERSGHGSGSAFARPQCWRANSRSGTTGTCWPAGTSSRTGSGPAGRGCRAARPAGLRSCSASPPSARRSTTR